MLSNLKTCSKAYTDILMMVQKLGIFLWNLLSVAEKKKKTGIKEDIGAPGTKTLLVTESFFHSKATAMGSIASWLPAKADNRQSRGIWGQLSRLAAHGLMWQTSIDVSLLQTLSKAHGTPQNSRLSIVITIPWVKTILLLFGLETCGKEVTPHTQMEKNFDEWSAT